ncbi:hypothetical protein KCA24_29960, partial [Escherichia coli]|nr:hypothetical protein [Escherichia coli]
VFFNKKYVPLPGWFCVSQGVCCGNLKPPRKKNKIPRGHLPGLGIFLKIVIFCMFWLGKKMVDEFQQNSGQ